MISLVKKKKRRRRWSFLGNFYLLFHTILQTFPVNSNSSDRFWNQNDEIQSLLKGNPIPFASFTTCVKDRYFGIRGVGPYRFKCTSLCHCESFPWRAFVCVLPIPHILHPSSPILTHSTPQSTVFFSVSLSFKCISCEQVWKTCQDTLQTLSVFTACIGLKAAQHTWEWWAMGCVQWTSGQKHSCVPRVMLEGMWFYHMPCSCWFIPVAWDL